MYPEAWLFDAKAVLDLGKFGVRAVAEIGTTKGALKALGELSKTDTQVIVNNIYRNDLPYDIRRVAYESASAKLKADTAKMLASGKSEEEVARWAHSQRNQLKVEYRDISPSSYVEVIEARNIKKSQDPIGPSIDWLRQNGKTWQDIIDSAARAGGNDLGFGGW